MSYATQLARAFIDLTEHMPADSIAAACDEVIAHLQAKSPRSVATFGRLVALEMRKRQKHSLATVTTPSGSMGDLKSSLLKTFERVAGRPVHCRELGDNKLLGGAVIRIDDEHYDSSIRSALDRLQESLLSPLPVSTPSA